MIFVMVASTFHGDHSELRRSQEDSHRCDTSLMLCLACALIVNSHLEQFWPWRSLALDGLLGNSFFYLLSGFGIGSSLLSGPQRFDCFLVRRLVRIYPAVLISGLLLIYARVFGGPEIAEPLTVSDVREILIWPTPYTYVRNIVAIYVIGYVALLPRSMGALYAGFGTALGLFLYSYVRSFAATASAGQLRLGDLPAEVYDSFDTALFLGGMLVAGSKMLRIRHSSTRAIVLGSLCIAYFGLKYAMVIKGWAVPCYPLLFGAVGIMAYLALGELSSPLLVQYVKRRPWIAWAVDLISRSTLEIYVIHQVLIGTCPALAEIRFPLNIVVFVLVSACAATMLRWLTDPLRRWVDDVTRPAPGVA